MPRTDSMWHLCELGFTDILFLVGETRGKKSMQVSYKVRDFPVNGSKRQISCKWDWLPWNQETKFPFPLGSKRQISCVWDKLPWNQESKFPFPQVSKNINGSLASLLLCLSLTYKLWSLRFYQKLRFSPPSIGIAEVLENNKVNLNGVKRSHLCTVIGGFCFTL